MKPLSRPRRPFWGPLKAILDFVGVEALQVVGVKKIQKLKTLKIAKILLNKKARPTIEALLTKYDYTLERIKETKVYI